MSTDEYYILSVSFSSLEKQHLNNCPLIQNWPLVEQNLSYWYLVYFI